MRRGYFLFVVPGQMSQKMSLKTENKTEIKKLLKVIETIQRKILMLIETHFHALFKSLQHKSS